MKFSLSWLSDHLETDAPLADITTALTNLGLEVEAVENPAEKLKDFIVAEITTAERHPNADRLQVCMVDTGHGTIQVVCGAPNARAGLKVAFAAPGVVIPSTGDVLKTGAIRGVESRGMLCSAAELGLGGESNGILELPVYSRVGAPLAEALGLTDPVIEIAVTPNRADCLGVRGIARDLAAAGLGKLRPWGAPDIPATRECPVQVTVDADAGCAAFAVRLVRGINNKPSPFALAQRLESVGLKPISAAVDVTNFLAFDLARPLHVFDADKVQGNLRISLSRGGEEFTALNGLNYRIPEGLTIIQDNSGVISVAGVIGGLSTACGPETQNVLLESAIFDPAQVARAGRLLGISSDARTRFERGVDAGLVLPGLDQATAMILQMCGGEATEYRLQGDILSATRRVTPDFATMATLGGLDLPEHRAREILAELGFGQEGDAITVPSWRHDIDGPADLVEEVLRVEGYDRIPAVQLPPESLPVEARTPLPFQRARLAKAALAQAGWMETVTWSFTDEGLATKFGGGQPDLKLQNPISADLAVMRPSVLPNLLLAARENTARSLTGFSLFEVGPVFGNLQQQETVASGVAWGDTPRHWAEPARAFDVFDAKAAVETVLRACGYQPENAQVSGEGGNPVFHPGRQGALRLGPKTVLAEFGEIHPRLLQEMDLPRPVVGLTVFLDRLPVPKAKGTARAPFQPPAFQPVERDFAFLLPDTIPAETVVRAIRGVDKALITQVNVFDVYSGKGVPDGQGSLAVSVRLEPRDKTLEEGELVAVSGRIVAAAGKVGAQLRA